MCCKGKEIRERSYKVVVGDRVIMSKLKAGAKWEGQNGTCV